MPRKTAYQASGGRVTEILSGRIREVETELPNDGSIEDIRDNNALLCLKWRELRQNRIMILEGIDILMLHDIYIDTFWF